MRSFIVGSALLAAALGWNLPLATAQEPAPKMPDGNQLLKGLRETPGCLGVETGMMASGKMVIFAWFEDKKAALNWYYSDTHREAMRQLFPDYKRGERKPLADVPADSGPIMAIASLTPGTPTKENPYPFKQIAIELYSPLGGGLNIGGKFAPEKMKVPERKPVGKEK